MKKIRIPVKYKANLEEKWSMKGYKLDGDKYITVVKCKLCRDFRLNSICVCEKCPFYKNELSINSNAYCSVGFIKSLVPDFYDYFSDGCFLKEDKNVRSLFS